MEGVVTQRNESGRQLYLKPRFESVSEYVVNQHNCRSTWKTLCSSRIKGLPICPLKSIKMCLRQAWGSSGHI